MKIHRLETSMRLPLARGEVFAFFAEAENLPRITPPEMHFRVLGEKPVAIEEGARIEYSLRLHGIPLRWRSLIRNWQPPEEFIDEQLQGPYKLWIHTHRFKEEDGGTTITDDVQYALPWQPLGELAHPFVRRQLDAIFRFRQQAIREILLSGEGRKIPQSKFAPGEFS